MNGSMAKPKRAQSTQKNSIFPLSMRILAFYMITNTGAPNPKNMYFT